MEKISPQALALVHTSMARTIKDFDITRTCVVKKPMVELAEVDWQQKRYVICLKSGFILNELAVAQRPAIL